MTAPAFLGFLVTMAFVVVLAAFRYMPRRTAKIVAFGLPVWLGYVGTLSYLGVARDPALRPPGALYIVGPVFVFVALAVVRGHAAGALARIMPLALPIAFQTFRVVVELFLHRLWQEGLVPKMLTYDGANVDIWIGASAPIVAWLSTKGRGGERVALIWNVAGLLALANVVGRAALTAPGPFKLLDAETANLAIGTFPYTFIAGFFAPLAVILHVLSLRALAAARRSRPAVGQGSPE